MTEEKEYQEEAWPKGEIFEHVRYSRESEKNCLDLYIPHQDEKMPLLVLIHGGGFLYGDAKVRQAAFMYRYFRDRGYACASVDYRLAQEAPFPGAVEDVKAAIGFLKAKADCYGYDADRMAVWGESAGAYLCIMAGVTLDEDFHGVKFIGEEELEKPVNADVDILVDFYGCSEFGNWEEQFRQQGMADLRWTEENPWLEQGLRENHAEAYASVEEFWLRREQKKWTEEEWNQVSPFYFIKKNLNRNSGKKILIWHGDTDVTVPWYQSRELSEIMKKTVGEDQVSFRLFRSLGHASDLFYSEEHLSEVKDFLDQELKNGRT